MTILQNQSLERGMSMPRLFNRVVTFKIEGEIYDNATTPEEIIKNYDWRFKDYNDGKDICFLAFEHKDNRGRITNMSKFGKIQKWKKPDTEYFLI